MSEPIRRNSSRDRCLSKWGNFEGAFDIHSRGGTRYGNPKGRADLAAMKQKQLRFPGVKHFVELGGVITSARGYGETTLSDSRYII